MRLPSLWLDEVLVALPELLLLLPPGLLQVVLQVLEGGGAGDDGPARGAAGARRRPGKILSSRLIGTRRI